MHDDCEGAPRGDDDATPAGADPGPGPDTPGPTEGAPRTVHRRNAWILPPYSPLDPRDCACDLAWARVEGAFRATRGREPDDDDGGLTDAEEAIRLGGGGATLAHVWREWYGSGAPSGDCEGAPRGDDIGPSVPAVRRASSLWYDGEYDLDGDDYGWQIAWDIAVRACPWLSWGGDDDDCLDVAFRHG